MKPKNITQELYYAAIKTLNFLNHATTHDFETGKDKYLRGVLADVINRSKFNIGIEEG